MSKDLKEVRNSHVDIWRKSFQAEKKANAKSLKSMPDMFEK